MPENPEQKARREIDADLSAAGRGVAARKMKAKISMPD
jgi:hypothetical protein